MKHSTKSAFPKRTLLLESLERRHLLSGLVNSGFAEVLPLPTASADASIARFASDYGASAQLLTSVAFPANPTATSGVESQTADPEMGEGESNTQRVGLLAPLDGTIVNTATVTLEFTRPDSYLGKYMVRLRDNDWDGQQVPGFHHDSSGLYLSLLTYDTNITVPVKPGASYTWWVHTSDNDVASASFTVDASVVVPLPGPTLNVPRLLGPANGSIVDTTTVTLEFDPIDGYLGKYMVRLHDAQWDGRQAAGFKHDSTVHYLSIATYSTKITLPVRPGASYTWWVHKPGGEVALGSFTVDADIVPPTPDPQTNVPQLLGPQEGSVVPSASVTLEFQPIAGYTGTYFLRLHDTNWDGRQAPGFNHDASAHYLCLLTDQTRVTVPVKPGASYIWWVHHPDSEVAVGRFSVSPEVEPLAETERVPDILGPVTGTLVQTAQRHPFLPASHRLHRPVSGSPA